MGNAWKSDLGIVLGFLLLSSTFFPFLIAGFPASALFSGGTACGGSSCGSGGSSGCGSSGASCGSGGSCATTGSSSCGSPLSFRSSSGSSLGSSPNIVSSTGCGGVGASACGTQTSGLAGGCQPGANSGCSGAATGCGPPSSQSSSNSGSSVSSREGPIVDERSAFSSAGDEFAEETIASMDLGLSASKKWLVTGEVVDVVLTVVSYDDYVDATTEIILPEGLTLVSQFSSWEAGYAKGQERVFKLQADATKEGLWKITAKIECFDEVSRALDVESYLYLSIGEEFWGSGPDEYSDSTELVEFPSEHVDGYTPLSPGTVSQIYGSWGMYECRCDTIDDDNCLCGGDDDGRECTGNSCSSRHYHYIPFSKIELWDDDTGADDLLATTYTDTSGYFEFNSINNVDEEGGGQEFYILYWLIIRKSCIPCNPCGWDTGGSCTCGCYTIEHVEPDPDGGTDNEVPDIRNSYRYILNIGNLADGSTYNSGPRVPGDSRAAHICFAVIKAYEYMISHAYGFVMPHVSAFYGSSASFAITGEYEIYIRNNVVGETGTDRAMNDDTAIHEYGHQVMWHFYGVDPRAECLSAAEGCSGVCYCYNHGGPNNDCSCDAVLEGWANFFAGVVPEEWSPNTGFTRNWSTDRWVNSKDKAYIRNLEGGTDTGTSDPDDDTSPFDEMCFGALLWDIIDPDDDGESMQQPFERGATWNDYAQNPVWFEMSRQYVGNDHAYQEEPYTNAELWWFYIETFYAQKPQLCDVFAGASRASLTTYCDWKDCSGYCSGACDLCVPNCADDPCGGAGCPGVGCVKSDCTTGWCDSAQPGQGCNGLYPSQCNCWGHGVTSVCSNAPPYVYCVSGCWKNPCACAGAGCPGTGCYTCTTGWCDSVQPGQGCNGVYPSQCNCYGHGVTSVCSNAPPYVYCVSGCWVNPCACFGAGCPGAGCYTCTTGWCDNAQPGQGCNGVYPSQCNCWGHGLTSICSNANPVTTCLSGCWINPCDCVGADCPGTGCYTCTGTVPDPCDCGGDTCICGVENDCNAFAANNFMPCGGTVPDPCVCGGVGCACIAGAPDCAANPTIHKPCGGTIVDTCDCGGVGCNCGSQNDCAAFAVNNFMPCGGAQACGCGGAYCSCALDCPNDPQLPCRGAVPCACGGVGCACPVYCSLQPPSPGDWILLATDPDEGIGTSLKEINGQRYSGVLYFKVEHYRPWTTITDIDTGILIDADQNLGTGMPDGYYGHMAGIGADYMILVGFEATVMFRWVGSWWDLANPIALAYLDAPNGASVFVVGVYLADVVTVGTIDCAVFDYMSNWDWMPDSGHFTLELPAWRPCSGTVVDACDCGGVNCNCGSENDCAAFAVNNFMPCGGVTSCECGGVGCACPDYCSLQPPSPGGWILLATDPDEGVGANLAEISGQRYSGVIYFRVQYYRPWTTITDIDPGILLDADQDPSTGMPDGTYPGQVTGIGADYLITVGATGPAMWRWVGFSWDTAHPISLAYLDAPSGATVFVAGVFLADVVAVGALDCAITDVPSNWDWMPDTGHFTLPLAWTPCGGTVVDTCDCGIPLCACGFENDCAAFAVNNFWPCEISAAHDVAVIAVTPSKTIVGQGYPMTIAVTVENHGTYTETFTVTAFANGIYIGSQTITLPGGTTVITIPWDTATFAKIDYTMSATADIVPCEIHTADNTFTDGIVMVRTPGDVNADGVVNILDAAGVSAHWYPGPPIGPLGYDPNYDINNDGRVDIIDAAIVSAYWTGPPKGPLDP